MNLKGAFQHGATLAAAVLSLVCVYYIVETAHLGGTMFLPTWCWHCKRQ
jgi:hypothetical protein